MATGKSPKDSAAGRANKSTAQEHPSAVADEQAAAAAHVKDADAHPTKDFFISVITRDIGLTRAILDLVDNSVDGAKRLRGEPPPSEDPRKGETKPYKGLFISITLSGEKFEIRDNCGGIPLDVARKYAFRFGREVGAPALPYSIGQFGIGMKRALFKLGNHFRVESLTKDSRFVIDQSVSAWKDSHAWSFDFADFDEKPRAENDPAIGTTVTVTELHPTVKADFARRNLEAALIIELQDALQITIANGLKASVNGKTIKPDLAQLLSSSAIKPLVHTDTYEEEGLTPVYVRMYVGVSGGSLERAGWYVFCNGRLVLGADQSSLTGWGATSPVRVPKFHNQFHRFRGYVYFDSSDAARLPWNTTKTGVDTDSPLYRAVRATMIERMKPVMDFLNAARKEEAGSTKTLTVTRAIKAAKAVGLASLPVSPEFVWPKEDVQQSTGPRLVRIKYERKESEVERAKEFFRVRTPDEVGIKTFEYWKRGEG